MFTDVQGQIIASSLEAVIEVDGWLYCWFQDTERVRVAHGLTPAQKVRDVVRRTRDNELDGLGHFELTMMREAVLAALAAGLELGVSRDEVLATVRQIQTHRTELAIRHQELEGADAMRTRHFRFNAELAAQFSGEVAGLRPDELDNYFAGRFAGDGGSCCPLVNGKLHLVSDVEARSREWMTRDSATCDLSQRWHLHWEVQTYASGISELVESPWFDKLPWRDRDRVHAAILGIAPLIDWDLHATLARKLGLVTPPSSVPTT